MVFADSQNKDLFKSTRLDWGNNEIVIFIYTEPPGQEIYNTYNIHQFL